MTLHGVGTFRPKWYGPKGSLDWSSEYVQQEVRGRGCHDLLITDGTAISNRHGFRCQMGSIHSASHRYFRNQVEAHQMELHLCSSDPCTAGEDDVFHVAASAIIPRSEDLDLQEVAGRGPLGRCMVATKFWGCQCAPFSFAWRILNKVGKTPQKPDTPKLNGPPLTGKEGARSLDHRPKKRKTGKYLCWDFMSHRGCKVPSCPHAHVSPPKWDSLDWSVQLQLLRRGGLKSKPACTPAQLVDQMENLRKGVKDKLADNVAEGKKSKADKAKQGKKEEDEETGKVGQQPPEEFTTFHPTDQEERLEEWTEGSGNLFYEDSHLDMGARVATSEGLGEEVTERRAAMDEVDFPNWGMTSWGGM